MRTRMQILALSGRDMKRGKDEVGIARRMVAR